MSIARTTATGPAHRPAIALLPLLLAACAAPMLSSDPVAGAAASQGLVYALPKGQVLLQASRRKVEAAEVETAKKNVSR